MSFIVFNTFKKAEHYVAHCNRTIDKACTHPGYDWETCDTYISGNLVIREHAGDGCGCGCDMYLFNNTYVIGRIKEKISENCQ